MVTSTVANPWMTIPALVIIVLFLALRWYYLKTARDIKRLEAICRFLKENDIVWEHSLLQIIGYQLYGLQENIFFSHVRPSAISACSMTFHFVHHYVSLWVMSNRLKPYPVTEICQPLSLKILNHDDYFCYYFLGNCSKCAGFTLFLHVQTYIDTQMQK